MMTEEKVTKSILSYLIGRGWKIITFDFPQSGTGRSLHPNGSVSKNAGDLIPDVVAVKGDVSIYMENKDHYDLEDFAKVDNVLQTKIYAESFHKVLGVSQDTMLGGVGIPGSCCDLITEDAKKLVDFVLRVSDDGVVGVEFIAPGRSINF